MSSMREVLLERIDAWLDDPESAVEYAEEVEGRWAVRMRQETRDATTVWFSIGDLTLEHEAYVMPVDDGATDVFRQALIRNGRGFYSFFALDGKGGLVLRGRLPEARVTMEELDLLLGEVYDMVEVSFRPLLRAMMEEREKSI